MPIVYDDRLMKSEPMAAKATPQHPSLEQLGAAVAAALGSPAIFQVLNTRLIIQTGVNLKAITPAQNNDPALLQRVGEALARMGIDVGGGRP